MKIAIVLLTLSFTLLLIGKASANNDRRPVGKVLPFHEAVSKKVPTKVKRAVGKHIGASPVMLQWLEGKSFTGSAKVKKERKQKEDFTVYNIGGSYTPGTLSETAQKTYDELGSREYIVYVTYKKIDGKLYCEVQKMWPVKK